MILMISFLSKICSSHGGNFYAASENGKMLRNFQSIFWIISLNSIVISSIKNIDMGYIMHLR